VLDEDNFDEVVSQFPMLLVEFYAPWCGHCKKLEPEYAKAAAELKAMDDPLRIAKIDATEARDLASKYGVRGFPTLKLFRGLDSVTDYESGRSAGDIVKYMVKKSGPPAATVAAQADVDGLTEKNDVVVLGLFSDAESAAAKTFLGLAAKMDDQIFGITSAPELLEQYGMSSGVVILKKFDEGKAEFAMEDTTTEAALKGFVTSESLPLVIEFSQETAPKIFGGEIKTHVLTFVDKEADYMEKLSADLNVVAKEYKGRALSVLVPSSESRVVDYFGVKTEDMPRTVIAQMGESGMKKYALDGNTALEPLSQHVAAYFAGSLTPSLKSEEPVPEDMAAPVKVVKGKSFKDVVLENDKDVLVEFYAPWCGHCKALAPKYDELAEKFEGVDSVVIAKMDATANEIDVDGVKIAGFPTLYFFPGNAKDKPVAYDGGREVENFVEYLEKHATTPFDLEAAAGDASPGSDNEL